MRYETVLGLRKEPSFDEVRQYIQADPDTIKFPKRDALFLRQSHIYAAVERGMRGDYAQARVDRANYEASDEPAPYVPPNHAHRRVHPMHPCTRPTPTLWTTRSPGRHRLHNSLH